MANRWERKETMKDFILGAPESLWMGIATMILKDTCSLEESYEKLSVLQKQRQHFGMAKGMVFPVGMDGLKVGP